MKRIIPVLMIVCLFAFTACSSSEPQVSPSPTPEATPAPVADKQVMEDVEIVIEAALDYVNENEEVDGGTKFSNAVLKGTSYKVLFADKNGCEIEFEYPDAAAYLSKAVGLLTDTATQEEIDAVLSQMADEITNDSNKIKETVIAEVAMLDDGTYTVVWNEAIYDAISGGLYSAQAEEGEQ